MLPTDRTWPRIDERDPRMPSQRQGFPPGLGLGFCQHIGHPTLSSGADKLQ